jgi:hypothetical protein
VPVVAALPSAFLKPGSAMHMIAAMPMAAANAAIAQWPERCSTSRPAGGWGHRTSDYNRAGQGSGRCMLARGAACGGSLAAELHAVAKTGRA